MPQATENRRAASFQQLKADKSKDLIESANEIRMLAPANMKSDASIMVGNPPQPERVSDHVFVVNDEKEAEGDGFANDGTRNAKPSRASPLLTLSFAGQSTGISNCNDGPSQKQRLSRCR
ncbi:hypothetical protein JIN84_17175 [Luteolibacter yonseiensis]|uniref:Uncharacterized protein n=1 Tax=Luteolibacter yonseiensis TaxID=1144680 RepID=A0A934VCU9_9BACT|nr:hypothetical protein [Luteolibacter yonseiensis]MBK1817356.1 hypothetical protein [Luteolibacter yonseiensis]